MMLRTLLALTLALFLVGCCCRTRCCPTVAAAPDAGAEAPASPTEPPADVEVWKPERKKAPSQAAREILARKRIKGLDWEEQNLDQVLGYLRTITGVNFYLAPEAREERFDEVLISAQLDDISVETLLSRVITDPYDLTWDVREGIVWILTREQTDHELRLRYYDVKDLVVPIRADGTEGDPRRDGVDAARLDDLQASIRKAVTPEQWTREDVTMEARHGILIVRAPRKLLQALDLYLARLRHFERR